MALGWFMLKIRIKSQVLPHSFANGHIMLNTPVLVRSLKLSSIELSQYLDGWPPGNTGCCWHSPFLWISNFFAQTLCYLDFGIKPQTSAPKSGSFNHRWRCSSWALQDEVKDSFYSPTWCYNGNKTCFYAKKCTQNFEFRVFSRLEWTLECRWEIRFQQLWKIEFSESFWRNGR